MVRFSGDAGPVLQGIRQAVRGVDPMLPLFEAALMEEVLAEPLAEYRLGTELFVAFGAFGLMMAVVGTYGVLSLSVRRRLPEFGIRLALGAPPAAPLRMVLGEGLRLVVLGLVIGGAGALALSGLIGRTVSEVDPKDPVTLLVTALVLLSAGGMACWIPALRATRVDPVETFR